MLFRNICEIQVNVCENVLKAYCGFEKKRANRNF